jgi:hypothetical protein
MAKSKGGKSMGEIVITADYKGNIKSVVFDGVAVKPSQNIQKKPYDDGALTDIVPIHILKFMDFKSGQVKVCVHAWNCWMYCH